MEVQPKFPTHRFLNDRFAHYLLITPPEREQLHRFRLQGERKPPEISFGDWMGPRKITRKHRLACLLHVAGVRGRYIARRVGLTESRLSIILSSSFARRRCHRLKSRISKHQLDRRLARWGIPRMEVWGAW